MTIILLHEESRAEALKPQLHITSFLRLDTCIVAFPNYPKLHQFSRHLSLPQIGLEALAMDNGRSTLIVFGFANPHLLEGGEGGQDRATNPDRVLGNMVVPPESTML